VQFTQAFQDMTPSPSSVLVLSSHQQHPEDRDGVIHWKAGEISHLEAMACPRTFCWIYCTLNLLT